MTTEHYTLRQEASQAVKGQTCLQVTARTEEHCQEAIWAIEDQHPRVNWIGPLLTEAGEWAAFGRTFCLAVLFLAMLMPLSSHAGAKCASVRNPIAGTPKCVPLPRPRPPVNDANGNSARR